MSDQSEFTLKVFVGCYSWTGGYGAFDERDAVVVANTKSEALGLLLEEHSDTVADLWDIEEIDTSSLSVKTLSEHSS